MKKYQFTFNAPKEVVIKNLLMYTKKPSLFSRQAELYASVSKNKKKLWLYHNSIFRNDFRPVFSMRLVEEENKTTVTGSWRLPVFTIVLSILWFSLWLIVVLHLTAMLCIAKETVDLVLSAVVMIVFPLGYLTVCGIGLSIEKKRMAKVMEHIHNQQFYTNDAVDV